MFNIGDRVVIRTDSQYYSTTDVTNPADVEGTIDHCDIRDDYSDIGVLWDNGHHNGYQIGDLKLAIPPTPEQAEAIRLEKEARAAKSAEELEQIKAILESMFPENWDMSKLSEDQYSVKIRFPEFEIKNSRGNKHIIREFYARFKLRNSRRKFKLDGFEGVRAAVTKAEYDSQYQQSHISSSPFSWGSFCLGDSEFRNFKNEYNLSESEFDPEVFEYIMTLFQDFIKWESLEGTPYKYISKIKEAGTAVEFVTASNSIPYYVSLDEVYSNLITRYSSFLIPYIDIIDQGIEGVRFSIESLRFNTEFHQILIESSKCRVFSQDFQFILDKEFRPGAPKVDTRPDKSQVIKHSSIFTFRDKSVPGVVIYPEKKHVKPTADIVEYYAHPALVEHIINKFNNEYSEWWSSKTTDSKVSTHTQTVQA